MKFLFLNNYYYMRGGSERVFFGDMALLESKGHEIVPFSRMHDKNFDTPYAKYFSPDLQTEKVSVSLNGIRTLKEIISSSECSDDIKKLLEDYRPEIVHAHNIYGRLTSSILKVLKSKKIPIVMTLHDYKLICPSYKMEVNGEICEKCKGRYFYQAVINRCLKDSLIASAVYAFESYFNYYLGRYKNCVDLLISPSQFLKDKLVEFGWSPEKIRVVRNTVDLDDFSPSYEPGSYILYIGRLSREKGINTLLEAYKKADTKKKLVIAGSGPLETELKESAKGIPEIEFTGHLDGDKLKAVIKESKAIVVPSEWYENAPMSVLEAMAYGKPVIGARIGGIPEMIQNNITGVLYESGNVADLSKSIHKILEELTDAQIIEMGKAARQLAEQNHSIEEHYNQLMSVYSDAINICS